MRDIENSIRELSKGYAPQRENAKPRIMKVYDKTFKPLLNRKDLDDFFDLYEYDDPIIKAWAFLGIYQILENKQYLYGEAKEKLENIVVDILDNNDKISYYSGDIETTVSIRTHHGRRISWLHPDIVFEPVYEYVKSKAPEMDKVIGELLEELLSKANDPKVEDLLLEYAQNIYSNDIEGKHVILQGFKNFGENTDLAHKEQVTEVFKTYLQDLWQKRKSSKNNKLSNNQQELEHELIKIGALLDLELESETLKFLENLNGPFAALDQVAEHYKNNETFQSLLMEKLGNTTNQRFIKDILKAISLIKDQIPNCQELVIKKIEKYEFADTGLIMNLMESNLLDKSILLEMLKQGEKWQLEFVREFLNLYPEKLDEWNDLYDEVSSILTSFQDESSDKDSDSEFYQKKEFALNVVIDLKHPKLVQHCLTNFSNLDDDKLRKMALFSIITFGEDDLLLDLRKLMEQDETTQQYVKRFWNQLERRDWKFYY
ncbi:MAG: hypothetical protein EU541_08365 [Promethearchaeota archaeon]|nr:MAG: hypothetical protein EU541_08365 [Candidatus Lokiarchaeota archaeon]